FIQGQTKGQYPAPLAALNVMLEASVVDADTAATMEAEGFADLFNTPISKALINVFFLTDRNKKDTGSTDRSLKPQPVTSVGVVGAGIMGSGIAAATAKRDLPVTINDTRPQALADGVRRAIEEAAYDKTAKAPTTEKMLKIAPLVRSVATPVEFSHCDLV